MVRGNGTATTPERTDVEEVRRRVAGLGRVLGVWAHPDDESYLSAGILAAAVDNGQPVACLHAVHPTSCRHLPTGDFRSRELHAALDALCVREHRGLGYADGVCATVDEHAAGAAVSAVMDEIRPDTILTFGPDGLTGHADHRSVSRWATAARARAAPHARLLYAAVTPDDLAAFADIDAAFSVYVPPAPLTTPPERLALSLRMSGELLDRKLRALAAHESQTAGIRAAVGESRYAEWVRPEMYVAAP